MTRDEEAEYREILQAVNDVKLDFGHFTEWAKRKKFEILDTGRYGWWYWNTPHGKLGHNMTRAVPGDPVVISFCWYIPSSTNEPNEEVVPVVRRGRSASGVSLTAANLKALFSQAAIEDRVKYVCGMNAIPIESNGDDLTHDTTIVDDLLNTDDEDETSIELFFEDVFAELKLWFDFDSSVGERMADRFRTVGDIIRHVQLTYRGV